MKTGPFGQDRDLVLRYETALDKKLHKVMGAMPSYLPGGATTTSRARPSRNS